MLVYPWSAQHGARFILAVALIASLDVCAAAESVPAAVASKATEATESLSPVTITWTRTRSTTLPEKELIERMGYSSTARVFLSPETVRLIWSGGKMRLHYWRQRPETKIVNGEPQASMEPDDPLVEVEQEISVDGESLYNGSPHSDAPSLLSREPLSRAATRPGRILMFVPPTYFYDAGIMFPYSLSEVQSHDPPRPLLISVSRRGATVVAAGKDVVDETECDVFDVSIESPEWFEEPVQRFYLDPERGYAVRRRISKAKSGEVSAVVNCSDFVKLTGALWLPRHIDVDRHTASTMRGRYSDVALYRDTYDVTELHQQPVDDSVFVIRYQKAGDYISDSTGPDAAAAKEGTLSYRVPANVAELDKVIEDAKRGGVPNTRRRSYWLIVIVNVVIAVGGAWAYLRAKRRAS